ncbi:YjbF family lipoprotein [Tateyamaria sp. Alg231-49]|uniref:YjbF family lipoprotein n=1 Tax=Tateyamaria sp. Alg231-49 TaxID=1922219 RepID=UPI000D54EE92|nr:YjbF family lipoprotein [Tateyamaria sp. Alg231-49]
MIPRFGHVVALLLALVGCGDVLDESSALGQANLALRPEQASISPRFISLFQAKAPVLQVGFVDLETNGNLLLERQNGEFAYWISPEGAQLTLQSGILHSTRGFGEGLLASELSEPLELVLGMRSGWSDRFHTYLDGEERAVTRTYRCRVDNDGAREIDLFGTPVDTRLMRESCRSLDQEFVNLYWVAPSRGSIILSRQWAGPVVGAISTRIVPE